MSDKNEELALEITKLVKTHCSDYPPEIGMRILNIIDRHGEVNKISSKVLVSGSLPSDEVMQRMGDVQDIFDGRIECTECGTTPMTSREDGLCDQCREMLRQ